MLHVLEMSMRRALSSHVFIYLSVYFLSRCDRGFVQPDPIRQPPGAEVQTAGGSDAGRRGGGHAGRGESCSCCSSVWKAEQSSVTLVLLLLLQDEADTTAERKNDQKSAPLENGLSPPSGPAGHTPVATTPKATAANQQAATTGSIHLQTKHSFILKFCWLNHLLCLFYCLEAAKPAAKTEDLVLSVLIGQNLFTAFC